MRSLAACRVSESGVAGYYIWVQRLCWAGSRPGKNAVQPGQVELNREHSVALHRLARSCSVRLGHQSCQDSSCSPPAGLWAHDTVFASLNLPAKGVPVDTHRGGSPMCPEGSCRGMGQRRPQAGLSQPLPAVLLGRPHSDCIRQAAIDLAPVYPWSLISINSSLEELTRDPACSPPPSSPALLSSGRFMRIPVGF